MQSEPGTFSQLEPSFGKSSSFLARHTSAATLSASRRELKSRRRVSLLGVNFDPVTMTEAMSAIEDMIASRRPHYVVTPNVDFVVQAQHDEKLRRILCAADLALCDGTPLLWTARLLGTPLPERVAGADLVPVLIARAAKAHWRLFLLGASPESAAEAVAALRGRHPDLIIAGHYSPPIRPLEGMDHDEIRRRIQAAAPDLVLVAFGCPKAEKWMSMHYRTLGVPVMIGVGGTIDFLAGRVRRAPRWMRRVGAEWLFRLIQEPRRLWSRYARDLWEFGHRLPAECWRRQIQKRREMEPLLGQTPGVSRGLSTSTRRL